MTPQNNPRVGQKIGDVVNEGGGLIAKMGLWLQQTLKLLGRNPTTTVAAVTVGPSPFTYDNTSDFDVDVLLSGGAVSAVAFGRAGVFYQLAAGIVRLNPGDSLRIAYTVAPAFLVIPR